MYSPLSQSALITSPNNVRRLETGLYCGTYPCRAITRYSSPRLSDKTRTTHRGLITCELLHSCRTSQTPSKRRTDERTDRRHDIFAASVRPFVRSLLDGVWHNMQQVNRCDSLCSSRPPSLRIFGICNFTLLYVPCLRKRTRDKNISAFCIKRKSAA